MTDENSSLKERAEQTIINLFDGHPILGTLVPIKPGDDATIARPYMSVKCLLQKEVSPGAGLFRIGLAIDLVFNARDANQTGPDLDVCAEAVHEILTDAQNLVSDYGLIREGETQTIEGDATRRRTINCTLIAA